MANGWFRAFWAAPPPVSSGPSKASRPSSLAAHELPIASYGARGFTKFVDGCSRSTTANSRETAFFTTKFGPLGIGAALPLTVIGVVSRRVLAGTPGARLRRCQGKLGLGIPMMGSRGLYRTVEGVLAEPIRIDRGPSLKVPVEEALPPAILPPECPLYRVRRRAYTPRDFASWSSITQSLLYPHRPESLMERLIWVY